MEPREIDAALAQRLFGLPAREWNDDTPCPECGGEMRYCGHRSRCMNCDEWRYQAYREYSDTWEGAGAVVEAMRERGFEFWAQMTTDESVEWMAAFYPPKKSDAEWIRFGDTAPLAIARAALAALDAQTIASADAIRQATKKL